jgi:hypothetical protein
MGDDCFASPLPEYRKQHRHSLNAQFKEKMRYAAYRFMTALTVVLALSACNNLQDRHESAGANGGILQHDQIADTHVSSGTQAEVPHVAPPADKRVYINLHVFGLSYHPDRAGTRVNHLDNELNVGLGLGYKLYEDKLGVVVSEAGFYKDSGRHWAKFAGVGYQFKITDRWKLGADLLAIQSPTYNFGDAFVAPIPRVSYDFTRVKINLVYVPRYKDVNYYAVYALYFTIPVWK